MFNSAKQKSLLRTLVAALVTIFIIGLTFSDKSYAEDGVYYVEDNSYNLCDYINFAINSGKSEVRICTNFSDGVGLELGKEIKIIRGYGKSFFGPSGPKVVDLGWVSEFPITFIDGADILVEDINFTARENKADAIGAKVYINEGANVHFKNCTFANTVVNNGTALFENCTFSTGKIENNGTATYTGSTDEPENIGTLPEVPNFTELSITLGETSISTEVGISAEKDIKAQIEGTNKDKAKVSIAISPEDSGLAAEYKDGVVKISGDAAKAGTYKLIVKAEAEKQDGSPDIIEAEAVITIYDNINVVLKGVLQSYYVNGIGEPEAFNNVDTITRSTPGGGANPGGEIGSDFPQNSLKVLVSEGSGELINFSDFRSKYPDAEIKFEIKPSDSGMKPIFMMNTVSLTGTPSKIGKYELVAHVTQGEREAYSEPSIFRIYDANVTLENRFKLLPEETSKWDMEPYVISKVGHAVVPLTLSEIYGSHVSGIYGTIGNADTYATETIVIPEGADVKIYNMKIYSSVKIIVEKGGKLTIDDSGIYGNIQVDGGTLTMQNSANISGSITLNDGSTLENAEIQSYATSLTDDSTEKPHATVVVTANGTVHVKGKNTIKAAYGDAKLNGQIGLLINDGSLILDDESELTVFGGGNNIVTYAPKGGDAVKLNNSVIEGNGKLTAIGGMGHSQSGNGGNALSGTGTVSVTELVAIGGDGYGEFVVTGKRGIGGLARTENIKIKSMRASLRKGVGVDDGENPNILTLHLDRISEDNFSELGLDGRKLEAYDVYFTHDNQQDRAGVEEMQKIRIDLVGLNTGSIEVFHLNNGKLEPVTITALDDESLEFSSKEFSPYIFAEKKSENNNETNDNNLSNNSGNSENNNAANNNGGNNSSSNNVENNNSGNSANNNIKNNETQKGITTPEKTKPETNVIKTVVKTSTENVEKTPTTGDTFSMTLLILMVSAISLLAAAVKFNVNKEL